MLYNKDWDKPVKTKTVLLKAADLIREHGLAKHIRQDGNGALCTYGAVAMAADGNISTDSVLMTSTMRYLTKYMAYAGICTTHRCVANWNNAPERTAKQVIAVLKGAANAVQ